MKRAAVLLALGLAACGGGDSLTLPDRLDPSPFASQRDGPIATDSHLDTVPVDVPVTLRWTLPAASFLWSLEAPPGSGAALDDPASATPVFTPDVTGTYRVTATVAGLAGTALKEASYRITAATYLGFAACDECHPALAASAGATPHLRTVADNGAAVFGTPGCTQCHVLDPFDPPAAPVPGGFADEAARAGFDHAAFTTFDAFAAGFPAVADRAKVQCESCHGPGSGHDSDPRGIARSLRAALCGDCHNGTVGPDRAAQWSGSAHGKAPPGAALADPACARCHTAEGFLDHVAGRPAEAQGPGTPGVACAACHDPHTIDNAAQVRIFGTVPLATGGAKDSGRAASCVVCHQSDIPDPAAHAAAGGGLPCAVQADMLNGQGAVEYGFDFGTSFHGTTVFRLRPFTSRPEDSDTPDACVVCHMAPGSGSDRLGAHAMRQRDGAALFGAGNCDRCHPGLTIFDRNLGEDFDGDGSPEGVQTEVTGLLEIVHAALRAADAGGGLTRPGGALTLITVDADLTRTTPELRQAVFNYNFVVSDGSRGIHNTDYAVRLLQLTYEQVAGVPFRTAFPRAATR